MKVLQINSVCRSGSTGKIAYELYRRGNEDGHEFAVCYGRGKKIDEKNIFKFGLDIETYAHAFLTRITGWTGCFSPLSTRRLLKFMDEFKPDIVHLHEPHAYFLDQKTFFDYLAENKIPLVFTMHCEMAFTGKCGHPLQCENWRTGCGNCPNLRDYPKALFFDATAQMLEKKLKYLRKQNMILVSPSKWQADRAAASMLRIPARVIKNGIDTKNVFYSRPYDQLLKKHGIRGEKIVLAVAPGLMSQHKGGQLVLSLAQRLEAQNIKFILIGLTQEELGNTFPDNVIALGRTENQTELAEYYSMADCFVICSDMENLPTTCLEAICCGTPVVGFDVGGTVETAPAPLGLFCKYGDIDSLETILSQTLENPPPPEPFEALRDKYSSENMYREYYKLYEELLEGN